MKKNPTRTKSAAAPAGELQARRIVLVDAKGRPRIRLDAGEAGQDGKADCAMIDMIDSRGAVRISLGAGGDDGFSSMQLISPDGQRAISLYSQPNGHLTIGIDSEKIHGSTVLSSDGLKLSDSAGKFAISLGNFFSGSQDEQEIVVFRDGKPVWKQKASASKRPGKRKARS